MSQTWAILFDAYRELNARKLFWVVMVLSLMVVLGFGCVALTPTGFSVLWWHFPDALLNSNLVSNAVYYKMMFARFGVSVWLTWISAILALVATCGLIPEFISSGSIELTLSKPISRTRLFLTKYAAGLLFTFLQVSIFSVATVLVIGIRGHSWEPRILFAIPIVTVFYSYLFSLCTLVGLLTRSAIFSLLATLLVWLFVVTLGVVESQWLLRQVIVSEWKVQALQAQVDGSVASEVPGSAGSDPANAKPAEGERGGLTGAFLKALQPKPQPADEEKHRQELEQARRTEASWKTWHSAALALKTVLPKTTETADFLKRVLLSQEELHMFESAEDNGRKQRLTRHQDRHPGADFDNNSIEQMIASQEEIERRLDERSVGWIIGTSLGFEAAVLGIACWLFSRRDF